MPRRKFLKAERLNAKLDLRLLDDHVQFQLFHLLRKKGSFRSEATVEIWAPVRLVRIELFGNAHVLKLKCQPVDILASRIHSEKPGFFGVDGLGQK